MKEIHSRQAETARKLRYRLYTVCEGKKRANEAMETLHQFDSK